MRFPLRLAAYAAVTAAILTAVFAALDSLLTGDPITAGELAVDFIEMSVLAGTIVVSVVAVDRLRGLETEATRLRTDLDEAARAGRVWRRQSEHLYQGLSQAVAAQFDDWGLTEAESDIAALLLKGATMKDIATLRRTSDATIRQQAQGIYRKSGLASRTELSAYFLEDLFDVAAARATLHPQDAPTH